MKNVTLLLALLLPCAAFAGANSTAVQVSFRITQACLVQQHAGAMQVTCVADTPYLVDTPAAARTLQPAPAASAGGASLTTVYF